MKKLVYLIYLLNFGLYYPMSAFCRLLDNANFEEEYEHSRWPMVVDGTTLIIIVIDTLAITDSATFCNISVCLYLAMILYLFYYKDKRKKIFMDINRKSRIQKLVLAFVSHFIIIVCWLLPMMFHDYLPIDFRSLFS